MSGRAGRRGLDSVGHVFNYFPPDDPLPYEADVRKVLTGPVLTLKSAFRLTYNMILNILRVDELRVEDMMQKSFSEAAGELKLENLNELVSKADEQMALLDEWIADDSMADGEVKRYMAMVVRLKELSRAILPKLVMSRQSFDEAFASGRIVIVHNAHHLLWPAIVLRSKSASYTPRSSDRVRIVGIVGIADSKVAAATLATESVFLNPVRREAVQAASFKQFVVDGLLFELKDVPVADIVWFSSTVAAAAPQNGPPLSARLTDNMTRLPSILACAAELGHRVCKGLPSSKREMSGSTAPSEANQLTSLQALARTTGAHGAEETLARWEERDALLIDMTLTAPSSFNLAHALWSLPSGHKARSRILDVYARRENLRAQVQSMRASAGAQRIPDLLPEYRKRVRVLQKMQYVGEDGVSVLTKGRHGACEVATVDSVLLTEIVLDNVLNGLTPSEIASLLSALVCRKKNPASASKSAVGAGVYSDVYVEAKNAMRKIVRDFGTVQEEAGVELDFEIADAAQDYEGAICRWSLCEVVLRWAEGVSFADVVKLTDLQEGDVVVTVKRLVELLKDAKGVAKAVGNEDLEGCIEDAIEAVRRDIIFSGSLYLT